MKPSGNLSILKKYDITQEIWWTISGQNHRIYADFRI